MSSKVNYTCAIYYSAVTKSPNKYWLILLYAFIGTLILTFNGALIFGIYKTKKKKYARNEKLVFFSSILDLLVGCVHVPLQIVLIINLDHIGCIHISITGFCHIFLEKFSGSVTALICFDRFITLVLNNNCCGFLFKDNHLIFCVLILFITSLGTSFWYAICFLSKSHYQLSIFFFNLATCTLIFLIVVTIINLFFLNDTVKSLRNVGIQFQKNQILEKRLTKTIMLISITLVISYGPSVVIHYCLAVALKNEDRNSVINVMLIQFWILALYKLNSAFNAFIYISRSSRVSQMFLSRFRKLLKKSARKQ